MKQPDNGLWRKLGLRDNYLPPIFAAVLLFSSFCVKAQTYTTINGRFNYADSIKLSKLKNNANQDSVLTTDSTGRIKFKFVTTGSSSIDITGEVAASSSSSTITLNNTPLSSSVKLLKNGVRLPPQNYSISGANITLTDPRLFTDILETDYKIAGTSPLSTEVTGELITGSSSQTITLNNTPLSGTVKLLKNGIRLPPVKYSLSGAVITLTDPRIISDNFEADYKY